MNDKHAAAALMVLTAIQVPGLFGTTTPDRLTLAKCNRNTDHEVYHQLRSGQIEGLAMAALLGGATSVVAKSPWPLIGSLVVALYVIWQQENNLNK